MIVEDREKFIKEAKLNHIIVRYIFAKSLYAVWMATDFSRVKNFSHDKVLVGGKDKDKNKNGESLFDDVLLETVASVVMNRFVFESIVMNKYSDIVQILTDESVFDCWRNLKYMDAIDTKDVKFRKCLDVAKSALCGDLVDVVNGAKSFHKTGTSNIYGKLLKPIASFAGYDFY